MVDERLPPATHHWHEQWRAHGKARSHERGGGVRKIMDARICYCRAIQALSGAYENIALERLCDFSNMTWAEITRMK